MSDFTFLTEEQYFGDDKLDILEKRGTKAAITDFSILLGAYVFYYHIQWVFLKFSFLAVLSNQLELYSLEYFL